MRKSIVACAVLLLAAASVGEAQEVGDTEFSVWAGGGLSTLSYKLNQGSTGMGYGAFGGVGYTMFFAPNFGVKFGLEAMSFSGQAKKTDLTSSYDIINPNGTVSSDTVFLVNFFGFEEKQRALYLNIPVMAHYQRDKFYASLGAKLGLGLNSSFSSSADFIATGAGARDVNYDYWNLPDYGFATYPNQKVKGNMELRVNFALAAELGMVWWLNDKLKLYTGVYADYGLTNLVRSSEPAMIYDPNRTDNTFKQSILNTQQKTSQGKATDFVDRVSAISAGLKVAVSISTSSKKSVPNNAFEESTEKPQVEADSVNESELEKEAADTVHVQADVEQIRDLLARLTAAESALTALEEKYRNGEQSQKVAIEEKEAQIRELLARLTAAESSLNAAEAKRQKGLAAAKAQPNVSSGAAQAKEGTPIPANARGLRYRIQVAAYQRPHADYQKEYEKYDFLYDVEEEVEATPSVRIYKYVTGAFAHVGEARKELLRIRKSGLRDAFLVPYYNGVRVTIGEANEIAAGKKSR